MTSGESVGFFFDLSGTLVEPDAPLGADLKRFLQALEQRVARIVLVTGQPSDDPQVAGFLSCFGGSAVTAAVVAYVTRGGKRLVLTPAGFTVDEGYLARHRLDPATGARIEEVMRNILRQMGIVANAPPRLADEVAVSVRLPARERTRFLEALNRELALGEFAGFQSLIEGRSSVFVSRRGSGKRIAVEHELRVAGRGQAIRRWFYFGNEFAEGNDREVLPISDVEFCSIGPCGLVPAGIQCRTVGQTPGDLPLVVERLLASPAPSARHLPALCLSLGGTKIQIGALTEFGVCLSSEELYWRSHPEFQDSLQDDHAETFCRAVAGQVSLFLAHRGYRLDDVGVVGVPFPGPGVGDYWKSNNLTPAFQREPGVALARDLSCALAEASPWNAPPAVRVALDAQCDAAGELEHPLGRLRPAPGAAPVPKATVFNVATGIAAGFVKAGVVLVEDSDFAAIDKSYDSGAGQVGRHLWYFPSDHSSAGRWAYNFRPRGEQPARPPPAIRLTDYLSGPALATRLLLELGSMEDFPQLPEWDETQLTVAELARAHAALRQAGAANGLSGAVQRLRQAEKSVARAVLTWADRVYARNGSDPADKVVAAFARTVADDLAGALRAWMSAPGWEPFGRRIVLTGGAGIKFLASSDDDTRRGFLSLLSGCLRNDSQIERSRLHSAVERECYFFLNGGPQGSPPVARHRTPKQRKRNLPYS